MVALSVFAQIPNPTPRANALPGGPAAQQILDGAMYYGIVFCIVGLILSAGLWAVGSFSNNYTQSINGKKGFLICAACALVIGAAKVLVQFFFNLGQTEV